MRLEYFDMIDHVELLDAGAGIIRATSRVPDNSPVFEGHFPGFPILPGVLLLEAMNHAAGYLLFSRVHMKRFPFFVGVNRAKFRRFVPPGATLAISARMSHDGSGFALSETEIMTEGQVAADAEIVMVLRDYPTPEFAAEMRSRAERLGLASPASA